MEKRARKTSTDPVQEHLREHKSEWNGDVSELISHLIDLKRGINGRVPKSSIKDPLPTEVANELSQVSNEYSAVLSKAKAIISEQEHYSASRKKSISSVTDQMLVEASWAGSRLWAGLTHWLTLKNKTIRSLRFRLLDILLEIKKSFKILHFQIVENTDSAVPNSLVQLRKISNDILMVKNLAENLTKEYNKSEISKEIAAPEANKTEPTPPNLMEIFDQQIERIQKEIEIASARGEIQSLVTLQRLLVHTIEKREKLRPIANQKKNIVTEPLAKAPESEQEIEELNLGKVAPELNTGIFALAVEARTDADYVVNYILSKEDLDTTIRSSIEVKFTKISNQLIKLNGAIEKKTADIRILNKEIQNVTDELNSLLETIKKYVPGNTFSEMLKNIPKNEKISNGAGKIKRWYNTQRLKINQNEDDRLKLDMVNFSKKLSDKIEEFLNLLEDTEADHNNFNAVLHEILIEFKQLVEFGIFLGRRFTTSYILESSPIITRTNQIIRELAKFNANI